MTFESDEQEARDFQKEQPWIYRYILKSGVITPGPLSKGRKNLVKLFLIQNLELMGKRVLDVGSADGLFSFYMASEGALVTGLEVNSKRIKKANWIKEKLGFKDVQFKKFDLTESSDWNSLDNKYDMAFCFAVLHRVSDPINLIGNLAGKSDTVVFEWKSPDSFFSDNLSLAFHETTGKLDPRNISNKRDLGYSQDISDSGIEKPYWSLSIGLVKEICRAFSFNNFKVMEIEKSGASRVAYAYFHFLFHVFLRNRNPYSWRLHKRIVLIASRRDIPSFPKQIIVERANWDGTEYSK